MYFFLKEPKSDKATPIILVYYINSNEKYFKYSTGQKIEPKDWDSGSRYPKLKRGTSGKKNKHISLVLDQYKDFLEQTINASEIDNISLTKAALKSAFNVEFKGIKTKLSNVTSNVITEAINLFIA
jgi:hypothetical protein